MKQLLAAILATFSTTHAKAAALSGAAAAGAATMTHTDPWPWIVSALGALVVIVKFPAVTRLHGVTNAVISVLAGGLGCQFAADLSNRHLGIDPGPLFSAFVLSALWPALVAAVSQLWPAVRRRAEQKMGGGQ